MFRSICSVYLLLHLIGDYYMQSDKNSQRKEIKYSVVLSHSIIYAIPFFILVVFIDWQNEWLMQAGMLSISHLCIDTIKHFVVKKLRNVGALPYLIDQAFHIFSLMCIALITIRWMHGIEAALWVQTIINVTSTKYIHTIAWACMLLLVGKPANITIRQILRIYKPAGDEESKRKVGALIGSLERIIMMLLLGIGQYTAIALVLTAKSIARYDMLKDKQFAEYYLLGTLLSTLIVLSAFLVLLYP